MLQVFRAAGSTLNLPKKTLGTSVAMLKQVRFLSYVLRLPRQRSLSLDETV